MPAFVTGMAVSLFDLEILTCFVARTKGLIVAG
jgi:hypothetical protein